MQSADSTGANAMQSKALVSLPVKSFTSPNIDGPSQPPRLPTELTMANPPAAAVPVNRALGSAQNAGSTPHWPIVDMMIAAIVMAGWPGPIRVQAARPAAATNQALTACQTRSPVTSECQPQLTNIG